MNHDLQLSGAICQQVVLGGGHSYSREQTFVYAPACKMTPHFFFSLGENTEYCIVYAKYILNSTILWYIADDIKRKLTKSYKAQTSNDKHQVMLSCVSVV